MYTFLDAETIKANLERVRLRGISNGNKPIIRSLLNEEFAGKTIGIPEIVAKINAIRDKNLPRGERFWLDQSRLPILGAMLPETYGRADMQNILRSFT